MTLRVALGQVCREQFRLVSKEAAIRGQSYSALSKAGDFQNH